MAPALQWLEQVLDWKRPTVCPVAPHLPQRYAGMSLTSANMWRYRIHFIHLQLALDGTRTPV